MEMTSKHYIKAWQEALDAEIGFLKNRGNTKYLLLNGRIVNSGDEYAYYFETRQSILIPNGSMVKIERDGKTEEGRMLSSEGKGIIISLPAFIGDFISEAFLLYEPWQLLDELASRLNEAKKSKKKRGRIKRLMNPDNKANHPDVQYDSPVKELYARSRHNPVSYVWGPPGTGKTYTLARVAANKYLKGNKVLVLAQSNAAVDVLMKEILFFLKKVKKFKEGDILRYGNSMQVSADAKEMTITYLLEQSDPTASKEKYELFEERKKLKRDLSLSFSARDSNELLKLEKKLAALMEKTKKKERDILNQADLIGTTLARAATDPCVYEEAYDLVIIDEASMCHVPQAAFAASLAKRVIVCGDFKQLPPIAQSNNTSVNEWLRTDIFHKSGVADFADGNNLHPQLFLLNEQRRMHPDISSFTNQHVYHSLVHDHPSVRNSRKDIIEKSPFAGRASVLVDTSHTGAYCLTGRLSKSHWNLWHLLVSFQLVHEAKTSGLESIGYVTPYRAQADLMAALIEDFYPAEAASGQMRAATVHKFQGSERDTVIFDSVDGYPEWRPGMLLTGKDSERLINVAITRTKGKFIHVGNREFLMRKAGPDKTVRKLVEHQASHGQQIKHQEIGTWARNHHKRLRWFHAKKTEYAVKDLLVAKQSVILSIPDQCSLTETWLKVLRRLNSKAKLTVIAQDPIEGLRYKAVPASLPFPFIMIDDEILWAGQPFECMLNVRPPHVAVRLESPAFIEQFAASLPIEYK